MFLARVFGCLLVAWPVVDGQAAVFSPEKKRRELLEKLGLQPRDPRTEDEADERDENDAEDTEDADDDAPEQGEESDQSEQPGSQPDGTKKRPSSPKSGRRITYAGTIHPMLRSACASCHRKGGSAGGTGLVLTDDVRRDYRITRKFVRSGNPDGGALVTKAMGRGHGGGTVVRKGTRKHRRLVAWIRGGAPLGASQASSKAPSTTSEPSTSEKPGGVEPARSRPSRTRPGRTSGFAPDGGAAPAPGSRTTRGVAAVPWSEGRAQAGPPADAPGPDFASAVHPIVIERCESCHAPAAAQGGFSLTGDAAVDHEAIRARVDRGDPSQSLLLQKAGGAQHGGGAVLDPQSQGYGVILDWIRAGAHGPGAQEAGPVEGAGKQSERASREQDVDAITEASPGSEPGARLGDGTPLGQTGESPLPFTLPFHLRLNGKFDFSYERRDYKDHPFGDGRDAFRTYHHFLFLSRSGAKDPFGFNVELLTQAFYEFNARIAPEGKRFSFLFKAGKILVPFGREPLFHASYGGRSGFDQEILPVIWAQPGAAANARVQLGPVSLVNDIYVVQGYALGSEDDILNLQNDLSPLEDVRPSFGDRVGVSWGSLTGWYSFLFNRVGFDRLLFMQAVDVELWRISDVTVLEDLVLAVGGTRADVSGGGAGQDYYHFGSYATIGYYPIEQLYLQYRGGLRTTDNRRGLYYDDRRADERDRSSHNVTIIGRYKGFYAGLQLFWNLEKANEQDDDFLRVTVGYEF